MNVPSLPTDSLYKFLATFGFLLFAISTTYTWYRLEHELTAGSEHLVDREFFDMRFDAWTEEIDRSTQRLDAEVSLLASMPRDSKEEEEAARAKADEIRQSVTELLLSSEVDWEKFREEMKELRHQSEASAASAEISKAMMVPLKFIATAGALMSVVGFFFWYTKQQRYLDEAVRIEAQARIRAALQQED
ncbi:MAG: hypothetical protein HWE37_18440 [Rhodobacteraceae bacterium]|nr:hypothetical protein [Paracoccaceae bacterium]